MRCLLKNFINYLFNFSWDSIFFFINAPAATYDGGHSSKMMWDPGEEGGKNERKINARIYELMIVWSIKTWIFLLYI